MTAPGIFFILCTTSEAALGSLWFEIERGPGVLGNLKIGIRNGRWTTSNRGAGEKREKAEKAEKAMLFREFVQLYQCSRR